MPNYIHDNFEYLDDSYRKRTAFLTAPVFHGDFPQHTDDPQFKVIHEEDQITYGPYDFLTYVGADGGFYHVTPHADSADGNHQLNIWFSHERRDGGGGYPDSHDFTVRNWDNQPTFIQVPPLIANNGSAPKFSVGE